MENVMLAKDRRPIADLPQEEQANYYLSQVESLDPKGKREILSVMDHLGMDLRWPLTTDVLATMTGIIKAADPAQRKGSAMEGFVEALHRELEPVTANPEEANVTEGSPRLNVTEKLPPGVSVGLKELRIPESRRLDMPDMPDDIARGSNGVHVVSVYLPTGVINTVPFGREKTGGNLRVFANPSSGFKGAEVFSQRALVGRQPASAKSA